MLNAIKALVLVFFVMFAMGCKASASTDAKSAKADLGRPADHVAVCCANPELSGCGDFLRSVREDGIKCPGQQAPAQQPTPAAAQQPPFFPQPGGGVAMPQQSQVGYGPLVPPQPGMMHWHGYRSQRVKPNCKAGARNINDDLKVVLNNSRTDFLITVTPRSVLEPCWDDRLDTIVVPLNGVRQPIGALPERRRETFIWTIPLGCLNGAVPQSQCPPVQRVKLTAWRDLGEFVQPQFIGEYDITAELTRFYELNPGQPTEMNFLPQNFMR